MNLKKPNLAQIKDPEDLLSLLVDYYSAFVELDGNRSPSKLPGLKAITAATIAALRKTPGDDSGEAGPRVALLSGGSAVLDGLQGAFAWNSTSTARDDSQSVINPNGTKPGRWQRMAWSGVNLALPGSVVGVQAFTAGGTYTPTAGTKSQIVELWGGGGGGSGAVSGTTGTACAFGLGGGAGAYARRRYAIAAGGTGTVVIGAGGAAGANTGAIAGAGGASTFTDGTTLLTAPGGVAGPASGAATANLFISIGAAGTAASTNGDVNGRGDEGGRGLRLTANVAVSGRGGATSLGGAGQEVFVNGPGNAAAANTGSGGSGGLSFNTGSPQTGGAGADGLCVITEFS